VVHVAVPPPSGRRGFALGMLGLRVRHILTTESLDEHSHHM
jgi:hypothetical protein